MKKTKLFITSVLIIGLLFLPLVNKLQAQSPVSSWSYIQVDDGKSKCFGLDMGDLNKDGLKDILAGQWVYLNPGGDMTANWTKVDLGIKVEGILVMDVDGDEYGDVIAQALPNVYWIEATNKEGTVWKAIKIGEIPKASHTNSQGFTKAQIIAGGKNEFVIADIGNIYSFEIPKRPSKKKWKVTLVAENTSDEGIGVGDIDGDGDIDIAAGRRPPGGKEPLILVWFENPTDGSGNWKDHEIGKTSHPIDRVAVTDVNGDNKADIIICEERHPGREADGNIFWFEQPDDRNKKWKRNLVATQYSSNNLDIKDMDDDGDIDIITGEHKGKVLELQLWSNDGKGNFTKEVLDTGKESHLGTQVEDMDGDGDFDIVSIGWKGYKFVHLWRNDKISKDSRKWRLVSTANGDFEVPNSGKQQTASLIMDADKDGINEIFIAERSVAPSVVMYKYEKNKWKRYIVEDELVGIEAGSTSCDIDGDGDEDIVFGSSGKNPEVWWWENPSPKFNKPWKRRIIKKSGSRKHHDQMFGDFDGDGKQELVFWNQGAAALMFSEIPDNPKKVDEWSWKVIYQYSNDSEMEPLVGLENTPGFQSVNEHEGFDKIDVDGDGIEDIVGGGRWFKYKDGKFIENIIDASYTFSRSAGGQFIEGGRPEIVLVVGDGVGPLNLYEWHEQERRKGTGTWKKKVLLEGIFNGHTLDVLDFNGDGFLDIFTSEMRLKGRNPDAKTRVLLGDGKGNFKEMIITEGYGLHESRMADLDGDGDLDVLGKPYRWQAPLLNIWINEGPLLSQDKKK